MAAASPDDRTVRDGVSEPPLPVASDRPGRWLTGAAPASLFVRQALFVFSTIAGTALLLTAVSHALAHVTLRHQIEQRLRVATADRAQMVRLYVDQQHERVRLVTSRTRLRQLLILQRQKQILQPAFREETQQILQDALGRSHGFVEIWIADMQGTVIAGTNPARLDTNVAQDPDFQRGLLEPHLGEPVHREGSHRALLTGPIVGPNSESLGVAMIRLDLGPLVRVLTDPTGLEQTGEVLVGRRDGDQVRFLFPWPHDDRLSMPLAEAPSMVKAIDGQKGFERARFGSHDVLIAYRGVDYQRNYCHWGMIAKIDAYEAYTPLRWVRRALWALGMALLLPALAAAYALADRYARPIMRLADSATALAHGDFTVRVPVSSHDELGRLSAAFNDMAARLQSSYDTLERRVQERTAELSRANEDLKHSNQDLQQFAYVASHDLQEPLRAIAGFTRLLRDDYGPQLDDRAREYMDFAVDGAQRMKLLIDNLLDYSRIETQGRPFHEIDSHQSLQQALVNLSEAIEESGAVVTQQGLGPVVADGSQLTQLFQNLIGNAIKFRGPSTPQIRVFAESRDRDVLLSVCDNGIGIEPESHQRIFTIFQRLHSQDEYPGTGIGLAICQRIVQRHGGSIWVESQLGQGSCFFFTLPHRSASERAVAKDDSQAGSPAAGPTEPKLNE